MSTGTVTAVWGAAYVRLPNGKLKALKVGDKVQGGEQILTEQDGIVQISPSKGQAVLVKPPATPLDKVIAAVDAGDPNEAPAAGLNGGAEGGFQPGLRVDRVSEAVGQLEFSYGTERVPPASPIASATQPLFEATVVTPAPTTPVQVAIAPVTVNEAAGTAQFVVTLSEPSAVPVTVTYTTTNGSATAGADYTAVTGTVTIPAGQTSATISVPITNDSVYEGSETFNVVLSNPSTGAEIAVGSAVGTIKDDGTGTVPPGVVPDDDTPVVSITGSTEVNEAAGTVTYTVTLSNASTSAVTVKYATQSGSATEGSDFDASSGTVTFAPGETSKTITVAITNDDVYEGSETYAVKLSDVVGGKLGTDTATTTIRDDGQGEVPPNVTPDDDRPNVVIFGEPAVEGSPVGFVVTLTNASTTPVKVALAVKSGDDPADAATAGEDTGTTADLEYEVSPGVWAPVTGELTFAPGQTQIHVRVATLDDAVSEPTEYIKLEATVTSGNTANATASNQAAIEDNDGTPTLAITGPADVNEAAGTITYTVTLSNPSSTAVTVNYATADGTAKAGSDYTA
ncbi:Calx-beta domain-containing protein, partial [Aquabacterium sp.]|uniref:Calx-beta domain-containing protein n=1 Tax=Aquabacterium sp. TaxID=1872578 RepID=UPI0025C343D6